MNSPNLDFPLKILIVDDHLACRRLLREALVSHQVPASQITEAESFEIALNLIQHHQFDLCLSDYDLAGQNAIDLLKATRSEGITTPFVAVTGMLDEDQAAAKLLPLGFDDIVHKDHLGKANFFRILRNSVLRGYYAQDLEQRSTVDALTGLANRRALLVRLDAECARFSRERHPFSVLFLDLNDLKSVNDRWGHDMGDQVLKHFAAVTSAVLRKSDVLGRLGGDEFLIVCPTATHTVAVQLSARIREQLSAQPMIFGGKQIALTVSIGISTCDGSALATPDLLIERADKAMYLDKLEQKKLRAAMPESEA